MNIPMNPFYIRRQFSKTRNYTTAGSCISGGLVTV
jgi:hypothetical protein